MACMPQTHRQLMPPSIFLNPPNNNNIIINNSNNNIAFAPHLFICFKDTNHHHHHHLKLARKGAPWKFLVRSSIDDYSSSPSSSLEEEDPMVTATATEESSPMEAPKEPPSLISALNVEKALRGIAITDVDHYGRLGLRRGCSYDQVGAAYQKKVKELSSQGFDEEELNKELELLKESYTILSSEEERRLYDWSLARTEASDRYMWPFEVDITQTPTGTPPPQEPEDVGPTALVGYFAIGWLVLAFTLSIVFNR